MEGAKMTGVLPWKDPESSARRPPDPNFRLRFFVTRRSIFPWNSHDLLSPDQSLLEFPKGAIRCNFEAFAANGRLGPFRPTNLPPENKCSSMRPQPGESEEVGLPISNAKSPKTLKTVTEFQWGLKLKMRSPKSQRSPKNGQKKRHPFRGGGPTMLISLNLDYRHIVTKTLKIYLSPNFIKIPHKLPRFHRRSSQAP